MEGQAYLTLKKKKKEKKSLVWASKKKKKKKEQEKRKKEKEKKKKEKKRKGRKKEEEKIQPTGSHPSVKGQRPQERWIGAHWESQETPVAQLPTFSFGLHYWLPVFWL